MFGPVTAIHRRLLVVVGVLLVITVAGMVVLWPTTQPLEQTDEEPLDDLIDGEVVAVEHIEGEPDPDTGFSGDRVELRVELRDGPDAGETVDLSVDADGFPEISTGDRVALDRMTDGDGEQQYFLTDFQRTPTLFVLGLIFVLAVLGVSRWQGLRSLIGLGLSLAVVVQFVVPAIAAGSSPPLVAMVGAVAVMIITLYLTHGMSELTTAAVIGTTIALGLTVLLGTVFVDRARITGFASDDAVFAQFAVEGLDLQGLVLAGLIIAALGVLDDVTISQSSTVFALHETDRTLTWRQLFTRGMTVGRDHIASVVNTLFLAYTGASIALLLLFSASDLPVLEIVNSELLAQELVKTIVGSLGLIMAVPLTTALAASVAVARPDDAPPVRLTHDHSGTGGRRRTRTPATSPVEGATASAASGRGHLGAHDAAPASQAREPDGQAPRAGAPDHGHLDDEDLDDEQRAARAWADYLRRSRAASAGESDQVSPPGSDTPDSPA